MSLRASGSHSLNLLQRRVVWCVAIDAGRGCDYRETPPDCPFAKPKSKDDLSPACKLEILRLDVPMDDLRILRVQSNRARPAVGHPQVRT